MWKDANRIITMASNSTNSDMNKVHRTEIKDDYDHEDAEIEYVIENVLYDETDPIIQQSAHFQNLTEQFNSVLLNSCRCSGTTCDSYNTCSHGSNYIPSPKELILNPNRRSKDLIYECSLVCKCDPSVCQNRLVQYGPRMNLEIITSKVLHKQYALRTNASICRGAFICEYAGEILTRNEAKRRMDVDYESDFGSKTKDNNKMNYVLCLNEYSLEGGTGNTSSAPTQQTFIDPRLRGNIGRYLNHSCQPNCEIVSVRVDCPIPKIAIFAKQEIAAGDELSFHYGGGVSASKRDADAAPVGQSTRCLCGSSNCEKFLPNLEF